MTPLATINTPDQSERARDLISCWLDLDPESQDENLARIIAASVHAGPGTALERFASSGFLDPQGALEEINEVRVPLEREIWLDMLGRFILSGGGRR